MTRQPLFFDNVNLTLILYRLFHCRRARPVPGSLLRFAATAIASAIILRSSLPLTYRLTVRSMRRAVAAAR